MEYQGFKSKKFHVYINVPMLDVHPNKSKEHSKRFHIMIHWKGEGTSQKSVLYTCKVYAYGTKCASPDSPPPPSPALSLIRER